MTAKEYLSQVRYIDVRINSKIRQLDELNGLATKVTTVITGMPHNPSGSHSRTADSIVKIIDLQDEINQDIDELVDLKNSIRIMIDELPTTEMKAMIELRYCEQMPWLQISEILGISSSYMYRIHDQALATIGEKLNG